MAKNRIRIVHKGGVERARAYWRQSPFERYFMPAFQTMALYASIITAIAVPAGAAINHMNSKAPAILQAVVYRPSECEFQKEIPDIPQQRANLESVAINLGQKYPAKIPSKEIYPQTHKETTIHRINQIIEGTCANYNTGKDPYSNGQQVDPRLVKAIVQQETGYNPKNNIHYKVKKVENPRWKTLTPKKRSNTKRFVHIKELDSRGNFIPTAYGLTGLTKETAGRVGIPIEEITKEEQNILGCVRYLGLLQKQFNKQLELVLAAYNAGPTRVKDLGRVPRIAQTKNYISNIKNQLEN